MPCCLKRETARTPRRNILRGTTCALNFIEDGRADFKEAVRLGFPGETCEEKMQGCRFTLEPGQAGGEIKRPLVVKEAYQVFECTWMSDLDGASADAASRIGQLEGMEPPYHSFNGITSKFGAHFILRVDKILMKERYYNAIIGGVKSKSFPRVPVDYGYRDNTHFWYSRFTRPVAERIAAGKEAELSTVVYAASRVDPDVKFSEEACASLVKVPRVFLKAALQGCVDWAKKNGVTLITHRTYEAHQRQAQRGKKALKNIASNAKGAPRRALLWRNRASFASVSAKKEKRLGLFASISTEKEERLGLFASISTEKEERFGLLFFFCRERRSLQICLHRAQRKLYSMESLL